MKVTEVRVGNTILHGANGGPWKEITVTVRYLSHMEKNPNDYKGITLTPIVLESYGFVRFRSGTQFSLAIGDHNQIKRELVIDTESPEYFYLHGWCTGVCKFLHHAQNIHYDITELEIIKK